MFESRKTGKTTSEGSAQLLRKYSGTEKEAVTSSRCPAKEGHVVGEWRFVGTMSREAASTNLMTEKGPKGEKVDRCGLQRISNAL